MNALLKKEIRLLLPSFLAVFLLETVQPWLWTDPDYAFGFVAPVIFFFGIIILAVGPFGRECSLGTFQLLLAQPIERRKIWRIKVIILFFAGALVFAAYFASCEIRLHLALAENNSVWHVNPTIIESDFSNGMSASGATLLVAFVSGLWTTLLFRQIAAAFWVAFLTPAGLLMLIAFFMSQLFKSASDAVVEIVLYGAAIFYSVSGFWLAHKLFQRAQDVAWTGGVVTFSRLRYFDAGSKPSFFTRRQHPIAALIQKELQLHHVTLFGMAGLFVLNLGVIAVEKIGQNSLPRYTRDILESFGALWFVVPLVIGGTSVAEERKLGTMEGQLCLPVSSRVQFAVKFFFALIAGGLFAAILFWVAGKIGIAVGVKNDFFENGGKIWKAVADVSLIFFVIAAISFYASTLTRNILQAMGAAIATTVGFGLIMTIAGKLRFHWEIGPTFLLIFFPTAIATFLRLAFVNFRSLHENRRVWRRNILGLAGMLAFSIAFTAAIYNRAWDFLTPIEPPHGTARLTSAQPRITADRDELTILLPDGRLWLGALTTTYKQFFAKTFFTMKENHFADGTNWVDATANFVATVGIQSDGSLWLAEANNALYGAPKPTVMTRVGNDTDWQSIEPDGLSFLLLKKDGTLWRWKNDSFNSKDHDWRKHWTSYRAFEPYRLGTESNWAEIFPESYGFSLKQNNGHAWAFEDYGRSARTNYVDLGHGLSIRRAANFDQIQWRNIDSQDNGFAIGVRKDGTLWAWGDLPPALVHAPYFEVFSKPVQIGNETNWLAAADCWPTLVALKNDGSLWKWDYRFESKTLTWQKLGIHSDWVAIQGSYNGIMSLAADGSLWHWQFVPFYNYYYGGNAKRYLLGVSLFPTPPRKPEFLGNIFGKPD